MIGIFDSGIGGTTILHNLEQLLPHENFIYYADSKNNPYGSKTETELLKICRNIVDYLLKEKCQLIVIACNTATTICLKQLRQLYPKTIFVGTVPPLKVAVDRGFKNILVMGTPLTIKSQRMQEILTATKEQDTNIYLEPCPQLAEMIEQNKKEETKKLLSKYLDIYQTKNISAIVLGCTHYPLVKDEIIKIMPQAEILDSIAGVSREVIHQLEKNNLVEKTGLGKTRYFKN